MGWITQSVPHAAILSMYRGHSVLCPLTNFPHEFSLCWLCIKLFVCHRRFSAMLPSGKWRHRGRRWGEPWQSMHPRRRELRECASSTPLYTVRYATETAAVEPWYTRSVYEHTGSWHSYLINIFLPEESSRGDSYLDSWVTAIVLSSFLTISNEGWVRTRSNGSFNIRIFIFSVSIFGFIYALCDFPAVGQNWNVRYKNVHPPSPASVYQKLMQPISRFVDALRLC